VFDGAFVDFAAESGSADVRRYRVVEATPSQVNGTNFARLDAAVLRIEPLPDGPQDVPDALTVSADPDGPLGHLASYCIVGYPAQPVYESGTIEGVDWAWVTRTLFGNVYGVKRLAPGMTHRPLGSLPGDKRRWVFGHDATTLGGNSGSPALAWTDSAFACTSPPVHRHELRTRRLGHHHRAPRPRRSDRRARMTHPIFRAGPCPFGAPEAATMQRRLSRSSPDHRTWFAAWHPDLRSAFCSGPA
jgi:hypothetical protein